jgi:YbbR domain-containing protein
MKRFLKDLFLKNRWLKLVSFLLALILWLTFIPEEKIFTEKTLTVPLEIHNIPSQMEIVEKPPSTVDVKIRSTRRLIGHITPANVSVILDLQHVSVNQVNFPLSMDMIYVPEGAEAKEVSPSQINLKLETIKEIPLEVIVDFTGEIPEGYKMTQYEVIPLEILVKGPESKIKEKFKLKTLPIDRSSLTESQDIQVGLILPSQDLNWASSQTQVIVRIQIQKKEEDKSGPQKKQSN